MITPKAATVPIRTWRPVISFLGKLPFQVLEAGVADEVDPVPQLLAPGRHDLGHDGGEIGVHDPRVEGTRRCLVHQVDDPDP